MTSVVPMPSRVGDEAHPRRRGARQRARRARRDAAPADRRTVRRGAAPGRRRATSAGGLDEARVEVVGGRRRAGPRTEPGELRSQQVVVGDRENERPRAGVASAAVTVSTAKARGQVATRTASPRPPRRDLASAGGFTGTMTPKRVRVSFIGADPPRCPGTRCGGATRRARVTGCRAPAPRVGPLASTGSSTPRRAEPVGVPTEAAGASRLGVRGLRRCWWSRSLRLFTRTALDRRREDPRTGWLRRRRSTTSPTSTRSRSRTSSTTTAGWSATSPRRRCSRSRSVGRLIRADRADPGVAADRGRRPALPTRPSPRCEDGRVRRGLPRGHDHPGPRPVADARQDRRGPDRADHRRAR